MLLSSQSCQLLSTIVQKQLLRDLWRSLLISLLVESKIAQIEWYCFSFWLTARFVWVLPNLLKLNLYGFAVWRGPCMCWAFEYQTAATAEQRLCIGHVPDLYIDSVHLPGVFSRRYWFAQLGLLVVHYLNFCSWLSIDGPQRSLVCCYQKTEYFTRTMSHRYAGMHLSWSRAITCGIWSEGTYLWLNRWSWDLGRGF